MKLQNDLCTVQISIDPTYTVQSADNKHYDRMLNPEDYGRNDFYKTFSIHIESCSNEIDIALVGSFYSYVFDCALLENDVLTVMQNDVILQLSIEDGLLLRRRKFNCLGCNFGLYRVADRYLIYGEIEIVMLDFDFNKIWEFNCEHFTNDIT